MEARWVNSLSGMQEVEKRWMSLKFFILFLSITDVSNKENRGCTKQENKYEQKENISFVEAVRSS